MSDSKKVLDNIEDLFKRWVDVLDNSPTLLETMANEDERLFFTMYNLALQILRLRTELVVKDVILKHLKKEKEKE